MTGLLLLTASFQAVAQDTTAPKDAPTQAKLPPIECPLRKAGLDPTKLKPFEEVEQYIQFLEREDRAAWQKPDEVVTALGLRGSEVVMDVGAGSGYFTFRLAKVLPTGHVIAIDSQPEMVRHVHRKVLNEKIPNVRAQVAKSEADPGLPPDADLVFICDVLLHVKDKQKWLATLHAQMKDGAKLVLIDFKEGELPEGPPEAIKVPKATVVRLCQDAGFHLLDDRSDFLPYQEFLVFRRD
jgi:FkbM family methyltransferase